jgi:hypothetical protein
MYSVTAICEYSALSSYYITVNILLFRVTTSHVPLITLYQVKFHFLYSLTTTKAGIAYLFLMPNDSTVEEA